MDFLENKKRIFAKSKVSALAYAAVVRDFLGVNVPLSWHPW